MLVCNPLLTRVCVNRLHGQLLQHQATHWKMGSMMLTFRWDTSSTGSGMNTSARSAVAPRAVFAGGVAVVGPADPDAAADMLKERKPTRWYCRAAGARPRHRADNNREDIFTTAAASDSTRQLLE